MYLLSNLYSQQFEAEFCSSIFDQLLLDTTRGLASFQVHSTVSQCPITRDINIWFHRLLSDLVLTANPWGRQKNQDGLGRQWGAQGSELQQTKSVYAASQTLNLLSDYSVHSF